MSPERFDHLLSLVAPLIAKSKCRSRDSLSPEKRLVITLRYHATGDSQQSESFNFLAGRTIVCNVVRATSEALWIALSETYLKAPETKEQWQKIAREFEAAWNFPNCLGALDGKHIAIECPKKGGSNFYNYKGFHSLVLMAMCDANYCFSLVDIGGYGRDNDASIFAQSEMGVAFEQNEIDIPEAEVVDGYTLPYFIVSDAIFPLKTWLMKPFLGKNLSEEKEVFNYRLSRCRRTIENTFGIFSARWRIFRRPIRAKPESVERIIKACVCLHNYLAQTDNAGYVPIGFIDAEDSTVDLIPGSWKSIVAGDRSALQGIQRVGSNNYRLEAKAIRDQFKDYFNSSVGSVSWQVNHVRSCGEIL